MMQQHFEFVKEQPVLCLLLVEVVIAVPSSVSEGLELAGGLKEETGRSLGVDHTLYGREESIKNH